MTKPIIFFSHSSKDRDVLSRLKDLFVDKTGGSIEVFLSSDGQSIPLGRNWVHRVEAALDSASLMIVFLTPNSVNSSWIYFEAGYAYSKNIRVIPVGFLGVDLTNVPPPLSLLQGFNIKSTDGLDNLIALVNSEFHYTHSAKFNVDEYDAIVSLSDIIVGEQRGAFALFGQLYVNIIHKTNKPDEAIAPTIQAISDYLSGHNVAHTTAKNLLLFHGVTIRLDKHQLGVGCSIYIDPLLLDRNTPLLNDIALLINESGFANTDIMAKSIEGIFSLFEPHSVSARIYGSDIQLLGNRRYKYKSIHFSLRSGSSDTTPHAFVDVTPQDKTLPSGEIRELIDILDKRKVFYKSEEFYMS